MDSRGKAKILTFNGKSQSISEWARELQLSKSTICNRLNRWNWTLQETLSFSANAKPRPTSFRMITYKGKTQSMKAWSRELGINYESLRGRVQRRKMPIDQAFTNFKKAIPYDLDPIDKKDLPFGVVSGYSVYSSSDCPDCLGQIYQIKRSYWTHNNALNLSNTAYSRTWRTRRRAIADLEKSFTTQMTG